MQEIQNKNSPIFLFLEKTLDGQLVFLLLGLIHALGELGDMYNQSITPCNKARWVASFGVVSCLRADENIRAIFNLGY